MNEESIFATALEKHSAAERRAYLDHACQGDPGLRAAIDDLLKASDDAGSFLEQAAIGTDATVPPTIQSGTFAGSSPWAASLPFLEPLDKPDRLGKLGHYEIIEVVGHGGMGAVLRAFDTKLSRVVAVKVMAPELAANPTAVKRFQREASAAAQVHHDHVVTIHAVEESHRPPYLVMQFIEGQTLQQKIDREGALPLMQILRIGSQMAHGLEAAHKLGLIHRDVKPANVLLENGVERVKITDFGLARAADDMEMTQAGMIAGTPQYMSPEQAKGEPIDTRSDLFSLGSVLYTMCTGRPAFRAETTMGVLHRVCADLPRPIREINAEIPAWLEAIVNKLLAKQPADRFQTATEVGDLLGQHLAHLQNPSQVARPAMVFPVPEAKYPVVGKRPGWKLPALLMIIAAVILSLPLVLAGMIAASWYFHHSTGKSATAVIVSEVPRPAMAGPWKKLAELEANGAADAGWVQLFNGVNLDGWRVLSPGNWRVENGVIHGSGGDAFLFSEVGDLEDFHLRVEFRINRIGDSGILFRLPPPRSDSARWGPNFDGLEAEIGVGNAPAYRTGTITLKDRTAIRILAVSPEQSHAADEWTTLEIIAKGARIQILINGKLVTDYTDRERKFRSGHIALTSWENNNFKTHVEFRKVEVRTLPIDQALQPIENATGISALRDLVAAKQRSAEAVKARFEAGRAAAQDLTAAEVELIEARIRLAEADDPPGIVGLYQELIAKLTEQRGIIKQLVDAGVVGVSKLYDEDGRLASARARLAQAQGVPRAVAPFDAAQARSLQEAWAGHLGVPVEYTNSLGMKLRLIPPGEFTMGTPADTLAALVERARQVEVLEHELTRLANEGVQRTIRLTQPFYAGVFEVRYADFQRFVQATGYRTELEENGEGGFANHQKKWVRRPEHVWSQPGDGQPDPGEPVTLITSADAVAFCRWLSQTENVPYALLTEAQWEFACRAGTSGLNYAAEGQSLADLAWTREQSMDMDTQPQTHRPRVVGGKLPNAFGLYDMLGNVWEYTSDWYADAANVPAAAVDPQGPPRGAARVLRGGAWYRSGEVFARSAARTAGFATPMGDAGVGFRVGIVGDLTGVCKAVENSAKAATADHFRKIEIRELPPEEPTRSSLPN